MQDRFQYIDTIPGNPSILKFTKDIKTHDIAVIDGCIFPIYFLHGKAYIKSGMLKIYEGQSFNPDSLQSKRKVGNKFTNAIPSNGNRDKSVVTKAAPSPVVDTGEEEYFLVCFEKLYFLLPLSMADVFESVKTHKTPVQSIKEYRVHLDKLRFIKNAQGLQVISTT